MVKLVKKQSGRGITLEDHHELIPDHSDKNHTYVWCTKCGFAGQNGTGFQKEKHQKCDGRFNFRIRLEILQLFTDIIALNTGIFPRNYDPQRRWHGFTSKIEGLSKGTLSNIQ